MQDSELPIDTVQFIKWHLLLVTVFCPVSGPSWLDL